MTASDVIKKYIAFFEGHGHKRIGNAPLVPINDPTTLFVGSGMQALIPYLLGEKHPLGTRLVNAQNCFRAQDIDEIGDNRHTTFFRMMGNWSLGDYFKKEQLPWLFTFLTDKKSGLGINPERIYVSVFAGDENSIIKDHAGQELPMGLDEEAIAIWTELYGKLDIPTTFIDMTRGTVTQEEINAARIFAYGPEKNWWSRSGPPSKMPIGEPGGGDSEIFFDFGTDLMIHENSSFKDEPCHPNCDCGRFMEIGNSVFMQFIKTDENTFEELPNKNVDFGGGAERLLAAVNDQQDVFKTTLFWPIIEAIQQVTNKSYLENSKEMRIIADHFISSVFIVNAGVTPSNTEQGYVLRRFIRRAYDQINNLRGMDELKLPTFTIIDAVITQYSDTDPDLIKNAVEIKEKILEEANHYRATLQKAKNIIEKSTTTETDSAKKEISVEDAFIIYTSHGLSPEQMKNQGYVFDEEAFRKKMEEHKNLSKAGAEKKFRGGLADHSEKTIMGHTATHLMHQALRDVLGDHVHQTGSNITSERVRFDFNYDKRLTDEEIEKVQAIVNEKIAENLPVHFELIDTKKAHEMGAIGLFMDTYGEKSKIYFIGPREGSDDKPYSIEFCGGPHVDFTGQLKSFTLIKQENLGKNQKRLYATVGL